MSYNWRRRPLLSERERERERALHGARCDEDEEDDAHEVCHVWCFVLFLGVVLPYPCTSKRISSRRECW